jgi:cysteine synthase A
MRLERLSQLVGRSICVKMESLNPGGTGKDRAALGMIRAAEQEGSLPSPALASSASSSRQYPSIQTGKATVQKDSTDDGMTSSQRTTRLDDTVTLDAYIDQAMQESYSGGLVVEGTSGSTGIALATLCRSRGHACLVALPDDQAVEKQQILAALGAAVLVVPTASISHPQHYVNLARKLADRARQHHGVAAVFMNQFENAANWETHYKMTGPELWQDCGHQLDAYIMSAGTGGTITGVGRYLKEKTADACRIVLVDPPGSVLYHKIQDGIAYTPQQAERVLKRHRYDTIAEGIGLDRLTRNMTAGLDYIDEAVRVTDQEALDMAHWILQHEGLWVGSSSAMNLVGAIRTAATLPPESVVVTMVCDAGSRHVTRFWNRQFCQDWGLVWPGDEPRLPACIQDFLTSQEGP